MDENKPASKPPALPPPSAKEAAPTPPPPPRWQDMINPERRRDPLRWLRH